MKSKNNDKKIIYTIVVFSILFGIIYYFTNNNGFIIKNVNLLDFSNDILIVEDNSFMLDTSSLATAVTSSNSIKYTNKNVSLKIKVKSENFNYLKFPDGTVTKERESSYVVTKNGTYTFLIYDNNNNFKEKKITVKKIDKTAPTGSCIATIKDGNTSIVVSGKDELSGIKNYVYYGNGLELKNGTNNNFTYSKELDNVYVEIFDNANNSTTILCKVDKTVVDNPTHVEPENPVPTVNVKTHDQRNDAIVYYNNMQNKDIKKADKQYNCSKVSCDLPNVYYPNMNGNVKVSTYNEKTGEKVLAKIVKKEMLPYVMVPNVVYYLEEENNSNNNEYIKLTGNLRMIKVDGTRNVRDLGGYQADSGKVKYGLLFRGANPNHSKTDVSNTEIFNNLGVKVIFDLRETSSWNKVKNKYLTSFEKMNSDTGYYLGSTKYKNTRTSVEQIMKQVVNGKSVFFHCAVGRDRTGTVANLIEGILGVPMESRLDDFELSYLASHKSKTNRNDSSIKRIYTKVSSFGGSDDQEKYINWFLSDSKNPQEDINLINSFRKTMIDGNPTFYKVENKKCVKVEEEKQVLPAEPIPEPQKNEGDYYPVITPKSDEKVEYKAESDSLKVYVTTKKGWYLTRVWAKDAVNQMNQRMVTSNSLKKPVELLKNAISENNLKNKIVLGFNANPPVKKESYYDSVVKKDSFYDYKVPVPLMIYNGKVLYNDYEKYSANQYVFYIDGNNQLKYVPIMDNNTAEERKNAFQNVINSGARNTFTFHPILVENGQVQDVRSTKSTNAKRNAICQIDDNNFIIITTKTSTLYIQPFADFVGTLGCKTAFNFDGGGSTALFYKDAKSSNPKTLSGGSRALSAVMYFTELD